MLNTSWRILHIQLIHRYLTESYRRGTIFHTAMTCSFYFLKDMYQHGRIVTKGVTDNHLIQIWQLPVGNNAGLVWTPFDSQFFYMCLVSLDAEPFTVQSRGSDWVFLENSRYKIWLFDRPLTLNPNNSSLEEWLYWTKAVTKKTARTIIQKVERTLWQKSVCAVPVL